MHKRIHLFVLVMFSFSLLGIGTVNAQQTNTENNTSSNETTKQEVSQERINELKKSLKEKLTEKKKIYISARCSGAQTKAKVHLKNAEKFSANHDKKRTELISKIEKLISKLKESGQNTSEVEAILATVKQNDGDAKSAYDKYITDLTNTTEMDCKSDPEGFRASLDQAKEDFKSLVQLRKATRKAIKEDLKSALEKIAEVNNG